MALAGQLLDACMVEANACFSWDYVPLAKERERVTGSDVWVYLMKLFNFNDHSMKNQKVKGEVGVKDWGKGWWWV